MISSRIASLVVVAAAVAAVAGCGGSSTGTTSGTPSGADFDRAFIDAMVPHHESAIAMAKAAKEAGLSQPDLVKVADDILATQQVEIDKMKAWRADWFGSSTIDPNGAEALGMGDKMMGMTGDAEALRSSGDVDTDFAQMMVTHHEGAIAMAELAAGNAQREEIKALAREIISAQKREIEIMKPHVSGSMNHG